MSYGLLRYLSAALLGLVVCGSTAAQDNADVDPSQLQDILSQTQAQEALEKELKRKRDAVKTELNAITNNINEMSGRLSKLTQEADTLTTELEKLSEQQQNLEASVTKDKSSMTKILAAIQRIESNPPPALAVNPADAADAARAGILMSNLNRQLNTRISGLRDALRELESLKLEIEEKQSTLERTKASVEIEQSRLFARVAEKNEIERGLSADYGAAQAKREALAAEAQSLQELINRLEYSSRDVVPRIKPDPNSTRSSPPPRRSPDSRPVTISGADLRFSSSKGRLFSPVTGTLEKRYSSSHPGISIETADRAEVFAPAAGRVDFAGAFKNYGNVVIINMGDDYFVLLTGLGQLNVQGNSEVSAGDSVALMPVNSSNPQKLYIEVRKNGSTLDPVPWFGTTFAQGRNG